MQELPLKNKIQESFKSETLKAQSTIQHAHNLRAVDETYVRAYNDAMWTAREIMYRVIDVELTQEQ